MRITIAHAPTRCGALVGDDASAVIPATLGLAELRRQQQRFEAGQQLLIDAVDDAQAALPDAHPLIGRLLAAPGRCRLALEQTDRARATLSTALRIFERTLGPDHTRTVRCRGLLLSAKSFCDGGSAMVADAGTSSLPSRRCCRIGSQSTTVVAGNADVGVAGVLLIAAMRAHYVVAFQAVTPSVRIIKSVAAPPAVCTE